MANKKVHKLNYVERKVAHMNRMGIPASIHMGAATPNWKKDELEAAEKRLRRND